MDLIFSFSPYEQQAIARARRVTIRQTSVRFAELEDLVIHKVVARRPRDLEDVQSVVLKNPNLDAGYTCMWLRELDPNGEQGYLDRFEAIWKHRAP